MEGIIEPAWAEISNWYQITGFKLTEYGSEFLEGPPIDRPSQYIDDLREQISNIDDQVVTYVRESLTAYNHGCYFSSTVMLGIASERLFEILLDAYINSISTPSAKSKFEKDIAGGTVSQQYDVFMKKLPDLTGKNSIIERRLRGDFKHAMEMTFNSIRSYRNYAAHPQISGVVPRNIIRMNLVGFPLFCQYLYDAIECLKNNTTSGKV